MSLLKNVLRHWLPLAAAVTLLAGIIYVTVQQDIRIGANDLQVQMAEDAARALASGGSVDSVVPALKVDIATSLAPYLAVFDDTGKVVASSGLLHDQLPMLPPGVFDYTQRNEQDRLSWQPEPGVRSAVVVVRTGGARPGFVMAGRSLREVEHRESLLTLQVGTGWVVTMLATLVAVAFSEFIFGERVHRAHRDVGATH